MAKASKTRRSNQQYGIAEWYGQLYRLLGDSERKALLTHTSSKIEDAPDCPFLESVPLLAPRRNGAASLKCNKKGGVCSIRNFVSSDDGSISFGPITATCPNRFLEAGELLKVIGQYLLGTENPLFVKEIPFLKRVGSDSTTGDTDNDTGEDDVARGREDVGRIDLVAIHPDTDHFEWCAVEIQAVYFSGAAMSKDYSVIRNFKENNIPLPGGTRRPDYRSSGPKRLMPQLQIKVPTLRRWGRKMAVIVDEPFFDSLGAMDHVDDVSNGDIAWFVVRFPDTEGASRIEIFEPQFTTLERAVEGLTAGYPTTKSEFEKKIMEKLDSNG